MSQPLGGKQGSRLQTTPLSGKQPASPLYHVTCPCQWDLGNVDSRETTRICCSSIDTILGCTAMVTERRRRTSADVNLEAWGYIGPIIPPAPSGPRRSGIVIERLCQLARALLRQYRSNSSSWQVARPMTRSPSYSRRRLCRPQPGWRQKRWHGAHLPFASHVSLGSIKNSRGRAMIFVGLSISSRQTPKR